MGDEAKTATPSAADVKARFIELLDGAKRDLLEQVKDSIYQIYANLPVGSDGGVKGQITNVRRLQG